MAEYEIRAIRYGLMPERTPAQNFIYPDEHDGPMSLDFFVWVVQCPDPYGSARIRNPNPGTEPPSGCRWGGLDAESGWRSKDRS